MNLGTPFYLALCNRLVGTGSWTLNAFLATLEHDATGCVVSEIHGKKCKVRRGGVTVAWPASGKVSPADAAADVAAQIEEVTARVLAYENTPPSPY